MAVCRRAALEALGLGRSRLGEAMASAVLGEALADRDPRRCYLAASALAPRAEASGATTADAIAQLGGRR